MSIEDAAALVDAELRRAREHWTAEKKRADSDAKKQRVVMERALAKYDRFIRKHDAESLEGRALWKTADAEHRRHLGMCDRWSKARTMLIRVTSAEERDTRIQRYTEAERSRETQRERRTTMANDKTSTRKTSSTRKTGGGRSTTPAKAVTVDAKTLKFIEDRMAEGKGAPTIAVELNKAGIKYGDREWAHYHVRAVYRAQSGNESAFAKGTKIPKRAAAPQATQRVNGAAKKTAAAKSKTAASKKTSAAKGDLATVKPDTKRQAAKAKGAAKKTTSARVKTTTQRGPAKKKTAAVKKSAARKR